MPTKLLPKIRKGAAGNAAAGKAADGLAPAKARAEGKAQVRNPTEAASKFLHMGDRVFLQDLQHGIVNADGFATLALCCKRGF